MKTKHLIILIIPVLGLSLPVSSKAIPARAEDLTYVEGLPATCDDGGYLGYYKNSSNNYFEDKDGYFPINKSISSWQGSDAKINKGIAYREYVLTADYFDDAYENHTDYIYKADPFLFRFNKGDGYQYLLEKVNGMIHLKSVPGTSAYATPGFSFNIDHPDIDQEKMMSIVFELDENSSSKLPTKLSDGTIIYDEIRHVYKKNLTVSTATDNFKIASTEKEDIDITIKAIKVRTIEKHKLRSVADLADNGHEATARLFCDDCNVEYKDMTGYIWGTQKSLSGSIHKGNCKDYLDADKQEGWKLIDRFSDQYYSYSAVANTGPIEFTTPANTKLEIGYTISVSNSSQLDLSNCTSNGNLVATGYSSIDFMITELPFTMKITFANDKYMNNLKIGYGVTSKTLSGENNKTLTNMITGQQYFCGTLRKNMYTYVLSDYVVAFNQVSVTGISLNKNELELTEEESEQLIPTITPNDATNKKVTWTSSNSEIASVDSQGNVLAKKAGSTTVTVKTVDGNFTDSCEVTVKAKKVPVTGVDILSNSISLEVGKTDTIPYAIYPSNCSDKKVNWTSSNDSIALVDDGVVTGVSVGDAIITITTNDGGFTDNITVTVVNPVIHVDSVSLDKNEADIEVNQHLQLNATVLPSDASDKSVTWSSSNNAIAEVDSNGLVTAKAIGTCRINVTTNDLELSAFCDIRVIAQNIPVTGVSISGGTTTLNIGATTSFNYEIVPNNATDKRVSWESSNPNIVTINSNGVATAINEGKAVITVKTVDGCFTDCITITVIKPVIHVNSISVTPNSLSLNIGEQTTIVATVLPENATDKTVNWSSSNNSVATIDANGMVTAISEGNCTITASTNDGNIKDTCVIQVKNNIVSVTSVSLNVSELTLKVNETDTLVVNINPNNATNKNVTWSSSDSSIVEVDQNGKITTKKVGNAIITVTTEDGNKTATCVVNVIDSVIPSSQGSNNTALIIGIVIGGLILVAGTSSLIIIGHKKRKNKK